MNPFENLSESKMSNSEALREILVSEIDVIRDGLSVVNMFFGESIIAGITMFQELHNSNKTEE